MRRHKCEKCGDVFECPTARLGLFRGAAGVIGGNGYVCEHTINFERPFICETCPKPKLRAKAKRKDATANVWARIVDDLRGRKVSKASRRWVAR